MKIEQDGYASRIRRWHEACGGLPISQQFHKLQEEAKEAIAPTLLLPPEKVDQLPKEDPALSEHLARECVDISIVAIGIVGLLGHDFNQLFHETMDKVYAKYPPERIKAMRALGLTTQAALAILKDEWNSGAEVVYQRKTESQPTDEVDYELLLKNTGALY